MKAELSATPLLAPGAPPRLPGFFDFSHSLRNDKEVSSDFFVPKLILLGTSGKMAPQIPAPGAGLQHHEAQPHAHA